MTILGPKSTSIRRTRSSDVPTRAARVAMLLIASSFLIGALVAASGSAAGQSAENAESTTAPSAATEIPAEGAAAETPAEPTAPAKTSSKPAVIPGPDLTPYAVLVRLNVPIDAEVDARFRDRFLEEFTASLRAGMGQMWTTTVELSSDPRAVSTPALARVSAEALTEEFVESGYDKVFLAGAVRSGSCWSMIAREWDAASQTPSPVDEASTHDSRQAPVLAADLLVRVVRRVARNERVDGKLGGTTSRAGECAAADAEYTPFVEGDLLTPFVRYYDRDRVLQQIRDLPWTFLRVSAVERARMECESVSAFGNPLSGSRRRMDLMAIAARPASDSTRLVIAPRGDATDPLPGCRVEVLNRVPTSEDPVEDRLQLLTDRRGAIVLTADPEHPLQHVLVLSGKALLARVPLIPGLEETMTLAIPDDAARLSVEGSLSVLEGELIDAVARRSMLMARARRASKARNWEEVAQFVEELDSVPDSEEPRERVAAVQVPAVQAAGAHGARVDESRIKKMCSDLQQAASGHLDFEKIREFRIEMDELRRATQ